MDIWPICTENVRCLTIISSSVSVDQHTLLSRISITNTSSWQSTTIIRTCTASEPVTRTSTTISVTSFIIAIVSIYSKPSHPTLRQLKSSSLGDVVVHRKKKSKKTPSQPPLPSCAIDISTLLPADVIIRKNPKLLCERKLPTLAQKLSKEAYFRKAIMVQCTVHGQETRPSWAFRVQDKRLKE